MCSNLAVLGKCQNIPIFVQVLVVFSGLGDPIKLIPFGMFQASLEYQQHIILITLKSKIQLDKFLKIPKFPVNQTHQEDLKFLNILKLLKFPTKMQLADYVLKKKFLKFLNILKILKIHELPVNQNHLKFEMEFRVKYLKVPKHPKIPKIPFDNES